MVHTDGMIKYVAFLGALSWGIISLMVLLNPSDTLPADLPLFPGLLFLVISTSLVLLLLLASGRGGRPERFFITFPLTFLALLLMGWFSALLVHRDYFTWPAQLVMLYYTIFLYRVDHLGLIKRKVQVYRALYLVAIVVFILWIGWVMLMSWAIVARTEPRWIESTFYNFCNGLIGLVMIYTAGILRDRAKQTIHLSGGAIYLDERNVSSLLSPQENTLIRIFLEAPHQSRNCSSLLEAFSRAEDSEEAEGRDAAEAAEEATGGGPDYAENSPSGPRFQAGSSSDPSLNAPQTDCGSCLREGWTASKCSAYRNLKNRIADAKKYLELLQIGTIVPVSENPRDIKEMGWRLRLFDDVRLQGKGR